jgi:hypothetical protein
MDKAKPTGSEQVVTLPKGTIPGCGITDCKDIPQLPSGFVPGQTNLTKRDPATHTK